MGAIVPAMEDRRKALILVYPGFYLQKRFRQRTKLVSHRE